MNYTMKTPVKAWKVDDGGYLNWPTWVKEDLTHFFPIQKREDGIKVGKLVIPFGAWIVLLPNYTIDVRDEDDFRSRYEQA